MDVRFDLGSYLRHLSKPVDAGFMNVEDAVIDTLKFASIANERGRSYDYCDGIAVGAFEVMRNLGMIDNEAELKLISAYANTILEEQA